VGNSGTITHRYQGLPAIGITILMQILLENLVYTRWTDHLPVCTICLSSSKLAVDFNLERELPLEKWTSQGGLDAMLKVGSQRFF
jgi:hypothetical protein